MLLLQVNYAKGGMHMTAQKRGRIIKSKDFDKQLLKKVEELSGIKVSLCDQCGICSASCPMVFEMDLTPVAVMKYIQIGQREVLDSATISTCATCLTCTVRCPRGLDFAKVAEALRQMKLRKKVDLLCVDDISEDERRKLPQIALVSAFRKLIG